MANERRAQLLQSELVRHPQTGELFMMDRDSRGGLLALTGPLLKEVWASYGPRALISLGSNQDWFVRQDTPGEGLESDDESDEESDQADESSVDVISAVLTWAGSVAWQREAIYRRVDEFTDPDPTDDDLVGEPTFVRTVYLLESITGATSLPPATQDAPPAGEPVKPLWSGPGPVSLG